MKLSEVQQFLSIPKEDWQTILHNIVKEYNGKISYIYLDANYLYNFHLDDFEIIKKFNILGRYDLDAVKQWHICLERWLQDQTVILGDKSIKPIKIIRTFDRVVNEGLESQAGCIVGQDSPGYPYRMIGDGTITKVTPSDKVMANEIDRINVNENPEGGSLSRDGATVYSIGNHAKGLATTDVTECGMASTDSPTTDIMFDHSLFDDEIEHTQNADAVGSTTVIYLCSA